MQINLKLLLNCRGLNTHFDLKKFFRDNLPVTNPLLAEHQKLQERGGRVEEKNDHESC